MTLHHQYILWKIRRLWWHRDTDTAAIVSIMSGYLWALCLVFPGDTLMRPTYRHMASVAPEWVWTTLFITVASLQVWRLLARPFRNHFYLDVQVKLVVMCLWWYVAIACMASQWPLAAAMSDTFVIAFATFWDFLRCDPRGRYSPDEGA
jgi:hypothetical protein